MDRRAALLEEVGLRCATSLDLEETARTLASLAVPEVADLCVLYALEQDRTIRPLTVAHADVARAEELEARVSLDPPSLEDADGVGAVMREGTAILLERLTEDRLRKFAPDDGHFRLLRAFAPRSLIAVPPPRERARHRRGASRPLLLRTHLRRGGRAVREGLRVARGHRRRSRAPPRRRTPRPFAPRRAERGVAGRHLLPERRRADRVLQSAPVGDVGSRRGRPR